MDEINIGHLCSQYPSLRINLRGGTNTTRVKEWIVKKRSTIRNVLGSVLCELFGVQFCNLPFSSGFLLIFLFGKMFFSNLDLSVLTALMGMCISLMIYVFPNMFDTFMMINLTPSFFPHSSRNTVSASSTRDSSCFATTTTHQTSCRSLTPPLRLHRIPSSRSSCQVGASHHSGH